MTAESSKVIELNESLKNALQKFNDIILKVRPNAKLKHVDEFGKIVSYSTSTPKIHHPLGKCIIIFS